VVVPKQVDAVQFLVPDFDGKSRALAEWKGRVVVVHFWSAGSGGSLADVVELQNLVRRSSVALAVVGVHRSSQEPEALPALRAFASRHRMTWTLLTDPDSLLEKGFGVTETPTTVVLDPQGRLVDRRDGPVDAFWLGQLEHRFRSP
jgi:peroxiredoxin